MSAKASQRCMRAQGVGLGRSCHPRFSHGRPLSPNFGDPARFFFIHTHCLLDPPCSTKPGTGTSCYGNTMWVLLHDKHFGNSWRFFAHAALLRSVMLPLLRLTRSVYSSSMARFVTVSKTILEKARVLFCRLIGPSAMY